MVSHEEWHKKYVDRIIYLKDGLIEKMWLKYLKFHSTLPTTAKDKILMFEFEIEEALWEYFPHSFLFFSHEKKEELTKEREEILKAGLESSSYFHIDDTGLKHEGKNHHIHVICNDKFSAFFITPKKDSPH